MSTISAIFPLCLSVNCGDLAVVLPGRLLPPPAAPVVHLVDSLAPLLHVPPDAVPGIRPNNIPITTKYIFPKVSPLLEFNLTVCLIKIYLRVCLIKIDLAQ